GDLDVVGHRGTALAPTTPDGPPGPCRTGRLGAFRHGIRRRRAGGRGVRLVEYGGSRTLRSLHHTAAAVGPVRTRDRTTSEPETPQRGRGTGRTAAHRCDRDPGQHGGPRGHPYFGLPRTTSRRPAALGDGRRGHVHPRRPRAQCHVRTPPRRG